MERAQERQFVEIREPTLWAVVRIAPVDKPPVATRLWTAGGSLWCSRYTWDGLTSG